MDERTMLKTVRDLQKCCAGEMDRDETINAALNVLETATNLIKEKSIEEARIISKPYVLSVVCLLAPYIGDKLFFDEFNAKLQEKFGGTE